MPPRTSVCAQCPTRLACVTSHVPAGEMPALEVEIRRRRAPRGEPLANEGEVAHTVQVIQSGMAFNFHRGVDGQSRPIAIATHGTPLGVFGVFGQSSPVSAAAGSNARICAIPVRRLADLAARNVDYSQYLARTAVQMCSRIASWSEAMRVRGVVNQITYALLLLGDAHGFGAIELPTHVALAELLGSTRETVARGLATLEEEGAIQRLDGKYCELRPDALRARLQRS